jgi:hypothetical protein
MFKTPTMSFVQGKQMVHTIYTIVYSYKPVSEGVFVKQKWLPPLLNVVDERKHEDLYTWQVIPVTFADICNWAYMARRALTNDHTRLYNVLYRTPSLDDTTVYPMVI